MALAAYSLIVLTMLFTFGVRFHQWADNLQLWVGHTKIILGLRQT